MSNLQSFKCLSPAKINLHLAVLDRREDGFHNLESLFLTLDFCDTLHFELLPEENTLEITGFDFPMEKNIIFKAISLFREKTGYKGGLRVDTEKCIPFGSGLGGGSSNAAAALLAANKIADYPLSRQELLSMAAALGSDVPFFVHEIPAAWVTGRGEQIEAIKAPDWHIVLVNPGFHSDTTAAYKLLAAHRTKTIKKGDSHLFAVPCVNSSSLPKFFNDFLPIFGEPAKSAYNNIISCLQDLGADFASLSGAGSTCFGVFQDKTAAERAAENMRKNYDFVILCKNRVF